MNTYCQSCLKLHSLKWIVGSIAVSDLALSFWQLYNIDGLEYGDKMLMEIICMARVAATWSLFAIAVSQINRHLVCMTEGGILRKGLKT